MARAEGFEPPNASTKNWCLTTWPRPINYWFTELRSELILAYFYCFYKLLTPYGYCFCYNGVNNNQIGKMNIIDHRRVMTKRKVRKRPTRWLRLTSIIGVILILLYSSVVLVRYNQPLPVLKAEAKSLVYQPRSPDIRWPSYGQAAVGDLDSGFLASSPSQTPRPIASITKTLTALAVLNKKPLKPGQTGETITLTSTDISYYNRYLANNGSVVSVQEGEKITQYQGLQAMMLPSANNMADTMASWAFGSMKQYIDFANSFAKSLGMNQTVISDASGFSPNTTSTAHDLILLGQAALKEPVLSEIVGQTDAVIPVHGQIKNVNYLLNSDGINGIKTGNTEEAGGCFLASAVKTLSNGQKKTVIAVVLGASARSNAMNDTRPLLEAVKNNFTNIKLASSGDTVGYYQSQWGERSAAVLASDISVFGWVGSKIKAYPILEDIKVDKKPGQRVGGYKLNDKVIGEVVLKSQVKMPDNAWRLRRAYSF